MLTGPPEQTCSSDADASGIKRRGHTTSSSWKGPRAISDSCAGLDELQQAASSSRRVISDEIVMLDDAVWSCRAGQGRRVISDSRAGLDELQQAASSNRRLISDEIVMLDDAVWSLDRLVG